MYGDIFVIFVSNILITFKIFWKVLNMVLIFILNMADLVLFMVQSNYISNRQEDCH